MSVAAADRPRGPSGRYRRRFSRQTLYQMLKRVALAAAQQLGKPPEELTHREWNCGRKYLKSIWKHIPQAHEVCRQLSDYDGKPINLQEGIRAALEQPDIRRYDAARLRQPERPINTKQSSYGLRRVAFALRAKTLAPIDYEEGREQLLHLARQRSPQDERALRELLPTVNQILARYKGNWNKALTDAGLKRRPKAGFAPRPGLAVPLATAIHFANKGGLPNSANALRTYARSRFALAQFKTDDWQELLERGLKEIEALHLPEPPPPGQRLPDFEPIELNLGPLPPPRKSHYTRIEIIEWGIEYTAWLGKRGTSPQTWRLFVRQYPGAPPLTTMQAAGGLDQIMLEGTTRGWRKRALEHDRAYAQSRSTKAKAEAQRLPVQGRSPEKSRLMITNYLNRRGASSMAEIARHLDVTVQNAHLLMKPLLEDKLVTRTEENPRSPKQRYALAPKRRAGQKGRRRSKAGQRPPDKEERDES